jgi:hypothetical protein
MVVTVGSCGHGAMSSKIEVRDRKKLEQKNKKVVGQVEGHGDSQSVKTRNSRHRGLNHHHIRVSKAKLACVQALGDRVIL